MASNEYLEMIEKARNKHLKNLKKSYKEIRNIYKDVSGELEYKILKSKRGSLTERFLMDYKQEIDTTIKQLNKALYSNIKKNMGKSGEYAAGIQLDFFNALNQSHNLTFDDSFKTMFSKVPNETIKEMVEGGFYKDGKGLSERIWFNGSKVNGDIDYIINKAIAEKKSVKELSQDLRKYVSGEAKKDWDFGQVYPNLRGKQVDYNAQRLARTSINHTYFLSNVRSAKKNPFVEAMHWELSSSHYERQVKRFGEDVCDEYANHDEGLGMGNFKIDEVPIPHPQCLCSQWPEIPKSLSEIGNELGDWIRGGSNEILDEWANEHGLEFIS